MFILFHFFRWKIRSRTIFGASPPKTIVSYFSYYRINWFSKQHPKMNRISSEEDNVSCLLDNNNDTKKQLLSTVHLVRNFLQRLAAHVTSRRRYHHRRRRLQHPDHPSKRPRLSKQPHRPAIKFYDVGRLDVKGMIEFGKRGRSKYRCCMCAAFAGEE